MVMQSASFDNIRLWDLDTVIQDEPSGLDQEMVLPFSIIPGHHTGTVSSMSKAP